VKGGAVSDDTSWKNDPLWYKDAVIYQVHVKSFFDHDDDGVGDFRGLTAKLDYIQKLGANTIWLMPFYPSPMRDDGYDISDYLGINPVYGTRKDFRRFVREAHKRELRVITELVVNHTSDQHPWFIAARSAPRGSAKRNFYVWNDDDQRFPETRVIFSDTEESNWAWDPVAQQYYWHRFFSHQPDLNHDNPQVVQAVVRVMRHWLDMGVDGLRLDAIPYLCVRDGTINENLPETHAIIKQIRAEVDKRYKNRMLLAEANQWPEDVREYFGDGDECHMAYHFPLMPRMYMAIALEDRHPIVEIIEQTPDIPPTSQWAIFLRNHDELTLEMVTDRERDYMYQQYATDPRMRVNVGIRRRLAPLMDNDLAKIQLMNSLLFSMPGTPTVYYGDELGMGDNFYLGDRNGVRTPMQWSPDRNGGFSRADPQRLFLPPIMDPIYGYEAVNVETQSREPASLLNWTRRILSVRRAYKAFGRGRLEFLKPGNRKILAYVREYEDEVLLCVANLKRSPQPAELDLGKYRGRVPVELIGRSAFPPIGELPYFLTLPGHGFYWFELASAAMAPSWHEEYLATEELPWLVLFDSLASFERREGAPPSHKVERLIEQFERDVAPRYLQQQRWFAGKDRPLLRTSLRDAWVWETARGRWLLTFLEAELADSEVQRYFLPLAVDLGPERPGPIAAATVARVRQRAKTGALYDAFAEPDFVRDLLVALSRGATLAWTSGRLDLLRTKALGSLDDAEVNEGAVRRGPAEGTNSTVVLGERWFVKGYRRLRDGVNPEWEVNRFLTDASPCSAIAPALGAVEFRGQSDTLHTLALVQAYRPNQGDGWAYTLQYLERYLEEALTRTAASGDEPTHAHYQHSIKILAARTADLHRALAARTGDSAFDPEPLDRERLEEWLRRVTADVEATCAMLKTSVSDLQGEDKVVAEEVLERRGEILDVLAALRSTVYEVAITRVHGDYHLGQVLLTEGDFVIVDFEGEPDRTFEERRRKATPLKDVAGMLRSFDYAGATALRHLLRNARFDRSAGEALLKAWRLRTCTTFLKTYREAMEGCPSYPAHEATAERLLRLGRLEKVLYEIRYELGNRPDWIGIPLQALRLMLESRR
jgi:maltose alpha-D-glucosyltransferase/alpha-amylase